MCLAVLSVRAVLGHPLEAVGEGSGDDAYCIVLNRSMPLHCSSCVDNYSMLAMMDDASCRLPRKSWRLQLWL